MVAQRSTKAVEKTTVLKWNAVLALSNSVGGQLAITNKASPLLGA